MIKLLMGGMGNGGRPEMGIVMMESVYDDDGVRVRDRDDAGVGLRDGDDDGIRVSDGGGDGVGGVGDGDGDGVGTNIGDGGRPMMGSRMIVSVMVLMLVIDGDGVTDDDGFDVVRNDVGDGVSISVGDGVGELAA